MFEMAFYLRYARTSFDLCSCSQYSVNNYYVGVSGSGTPTPMNQLVPYSDTTKAKAALTPDALEKLYNMSPYTRSTPVSFG